MDTCLCIFVFINFTPFFEYMLLHSLVPLDGTQGDSQPTTTGIPQGSPISLPLSGFYTASLTDKLNQEMDPSRLNIGLGERVHRDNATKTNLILYVDDGKLTVASGSITTNTILLTWAHQIVEQWMTEHGLKIDTEKWELIHHSWQNNDQKSINGQPPRIDTPVVIPPAGNQQATTIRPSKTIKWLGMIFDTKLTFHKHLKSTTARATNAINSLSILSNSVRGLHQKYRWHLIQGVISPMVLYASPAWWAHIWQYHTDGLSNHQIGDKLPWDRHTIDRTITLMKQHPDPYHSVPHPGHPRSLTPADLTFAKLSLKRGECHDGADVQRELFPNTGASTVHRALAMIGLNGWVHRKKPYLSKHHICACRKWDLPKWKAVWFTDESKFNLFGSDGKLYCCRGPGKEFLPRNVRGVVKHRGGNIQVWGVLSWNGPRRLFHIKGKLDRWQFIKILEDGLLRSLDDAHIDPGQMIFAQDNDPKHKAKVVQAWFRDNNIKLLPWPSFFLYMNIIEHAWNYVDRCLRHCGVLLTNENQLWEFLKVEWEKLDIEYIHKLYHSLPARVESLHKALVNTPAISHNLFSLCLSGACLKGFFTQIGNIHNSAANFHGISCFF